MQVVFSLYMSSQSIFLLVALFPHSNSHMVSFDGFNHATYACDRLAKCRHWKAEILCVGDESLIRFADVKYVEFLVYQTRCSTP